MRTGRPLIPLTLTVDERTTLEQWTRRQTTAQGLALRARIILRAATGHSNTRTARELRVTKATVGKWRARFLRDRPRGVLDEPRPGAPAPHHRCAGGARDHDDAGIDAAGRDALEYAIDGQSGRAESVGHWSHLACLCACSRIGSRRSSCRRTHCSSTRSATSWGCTWIHRIGRSCSVWTRRAKFKPWIAPRRCCRCRSAGRSGARTTTGATAPPRCLRHWMWPPARSSANVIAAIGARSSCSSSKRLTRRCHADLDLHLILDNYGTHKTPRVRRWLAAHPRFHLHFTPTSASWLNLVERWFALLTEKQIKRGAHRSTRALETRFASI